MVTFEVDPDVGTGEIDCRHRHPHLDRDLRSRGQFATTNANARAENVTLQELAELEPAP
jgi:hypothetical protein